MSSDTKKRKNIHMRKKILNRHTLLSLVATCAALTSCTTSEDVSPNIEPMVGDSELACDVKAKEYDDLESRSSLSLVDGKMQFAWEAGDAITVFADGNTTASQIFNLQAGVGEPKASFSAEDFQLTANKLYYAFNKVKGDNHNVTFTNYSDIVVDYAGQTQYGNASSAHLGDYDFLAAGVLCTDPAHAHFDFSHFGATLRLVITLDESTMLDEDEKEAYRLPADGDNLKMLRFTEIELFDKKNTFRQTHRNFSFSTGKKQIDGKDAYQFEWPGQTIEKMDRFKLHLNSTPHEPYEGGITRYEPYQDGSGENTAGKLITYMEVPPHTFPKDGENPSNNNFLNIIIKGYYEKKVDGNWKKFPVSYVYEHQKNYVFQSGKAHQIKMTAVKPEEFDITLNINHNWQHGDVVDNTTVSPAKSRATGDPGNDKEIHLPNHLYYIYCHDGQVVLPSDAVGAEAVTHIPTTAANWSTEYDEETHNYISTYTYKVGEEDYDVITLKKYTTDDSSHSTHDGDCTRHLYVVASNTELSLSASLGQSEESVVRELKYNIPTGDGAQVFMRDLYSTPWDATSFEGDLNANTDITLYHVAAMVDVKWNTETTPINSVSVNNVKNEKLYLFKPTENAYTTGSYSPSKTITDEDDKYLGREWFYLPQFHKDNCQYSIGLNSDKQTVTFAPDVTKGYTSWLRWLKKKN